MNWLQTGQKWKAQKAGCMLTHISVWSAKHITLIIMQEHSVFFSEKVFKPIAFKHPFILIAPPGSLSALKSLGYKTFSGLINESYDQERDDDVKRLIAILEETKRLDLLKGQELTDWLGTSQRNMRI